MKNFTDPIQQLSHTQEDCVLVRPKEQLPTNIAYNSDSNSLGLPKYSICNKYFIKDQGYLYQLSQCIWKAPSDESNSTVYSMDCSQAFGFPVNNDTKIDIDDEKYALRLISAEASEWVKNNACETIKNCTSNALEAISNEIRSYNKEAANEKYEPSISNVQCIIIFIGTVCAGLTVWSGARYCITKYQEYRRNKQQIDLISHISKDYDDNAEREPCISASKRNISNTSKTDSFTEAKAFNLNVEPGSADFSTAIKLELPELRLSEDNDCYNEIGTCTSSYDNVIKKAEHIYCTTYADIHRSESVNSCELSTNVVTERVIEENPYETLGNMSHAKFD
ncbi:hypothetical protein [Orientia tsutsugamushi]|uniref:Uncharacterized protein n=1 Tax=Orientia tsutsugamushi (strain Boryong) TaxID=357244 RepID=A5CC37_ORITB|nr:hypothetical protein [Orientia tsutsugamushi]CAM79201.1 hypothetical protein OTBS_0135 [Orientia tsutsugamushi str. Boryong]